MDKRHVFVHVHVPKTAGTSFLKVMQKNFLGGHCITDPDYLPAPDYRLDSDKLERLLWLHPPAQCYSSHRLSLDLPFESEYFDITAFSFIRDPVERFISHYFFSRAKTENWSPMARDYSLDKYVDLMAQGKVECFARTIHTEYATSQIAFLTDLPADDGMKKIKARVEEGKYFPLPTERFDDCCLLLERMFPDNFKDCCLSGKKNTVERKDGVSKETREKIRALVQADLQLSEYSNALFEKLWSAYFKNEPDIAAARKNMDERRERLIRKEKYNKIANDCFARVKGAAKKVIR